jgi:hypothetical protein
MLAILIGGLFTFLFGGLILILFCGARRIEEEIEARRREEEDVRRQAARVPRFFVVTQPASPRNGKIDEALLRNLQQYLEAEQRVAHEFVLRPSLDSLYRDSGRTLVGH